MLAAGSDSVVVIANPWIRDISTFIKHVFIYLNVDKIYQF